MLNKLELIGNVGVNPEIRRTQDGRPIATFTFATNDRWTDKKTGEKKQDTQWHRVVCFNEGLCGVIEKYVEKGSKLYIEGKLRSRKWEDKNGVEREQFECVIENFGGRLVLLDPSGTGRAPNADENSYEQRQPAPKDGAPAATAAVGKRADMDDEIPF